MSTVIEGHLDKGVLRVKLEVNRLDASASRDFKRQVDVIWSPEVTQVELDFKQVSFIDSSGVGALLGVYKRLPNADGQVRLTSVQAPVQSVIELLRLHRILKSKIETALSSVVAGIGLPGGGSLNLFLLYFAVRRNSSRRVRSLDAGDLKSILERANSGVVFRAIG